MTDDDYNGTYGSPPRVRSRHHVVVVDGQFHGITSACAEQTWSCVRVVRTTGDHLRVCGADADTWTRTRSSGGSPPRVRSRLANTGAMV